MLEEGDVIELKIGHVIYADVPEHFLYANKKGSFEISHGSVKIDGELSYLSGKYVVYKTTLEGGGHGGLDSFPDGHHVYCENIDNPNILVDFYQSGCFTAMITNIEPIGKALKKWVLTEK